MHASCKLFAIVISISLTMLACRKNFIKDRSDATRGDGGEKKSEETDDTVSLPIPSTGTYLADYDTARLRCDFQQKTSVTFQAVCVVVVHQPDGRELLATKIKDGISLAWRPPATVRGSASYHKCEPDPSLLSYQCGVTTEEARKLVEVRFSFGVKRAENEERTESSNLVMPYAVGVAAGFVPSISSVYHGQQSLRDDVTKKASLATPNSEPVGFQQFSFAPDRVEFPFLENICFRGDRLFFISDGVVYEMTNGMVRKYAGSRSRGNLDNLSHRLRLFLEPSSIACTKDAVYVASGVFINSLSSSEPSHTDTRVYRLTDEGGVEIVAGGGDDAAKDGLRATEALLGERLDIALTNDGQLVIADLYSMRIWSVERAGTLKMVVQRETPIRMRNGNDIGLKMRSVRDIAVGPDGAIYILDSEALAVYRANKNGEVDLFAGTGRPGRGELSSPNTLSSPNSIFVDKNGAVYISENQRGIKRVAGDGKLSQVVSAGDDVISSTSGRDQKEFEDRPFFDALFVADDGSIYTSGVSGLLKYSPGRNPVVVLGPTKEIQQRCDGLAQDLRFSDTSALAYNPKNRLVVVDWLSYSSDQFIIRELDDGKSSVEARSIAGCVRDPLLTVRYGGSDVYFGKYIGKVVFAKDGTGFLVNRSQNRVIKIDTNGKTSIFAGNGSSKFSGDGGPAIAAGLQNPRSIARGPDGSLYIVEMYDPLAKSRIRRIAPDGRITTIAGKDPMGSRDEGIPASNAFIVARAIAVSPDGRIFIDDSLSSTLRMIAKDGTIHTIAGTGSVKTSATPIPGLQAEGMQISDMAVTNDGTIYVVDFRNEKLLELKQDSPNTWSISVLFGTLNRGDCGSGRFTGKTSSKDSADAIRNSLAILCEGKPNVVAVRDTCPGAGGELRLAFGQDFSGYTNIVEVVKPCSN